LDFVHFVVIECRRINYFLFDFNPNDSSNITQSQPIFIVEKLLSYHRTKIMISFTVCTWFLILHFGTGVFSLDCEYSSREYQVTIRPEILKNSFKSGITLILDELTKIEKDPEVDFKVSLSSLKYKNVSVTEYILPSTRDVTDLYVPLRFKSRQKKANEPADIVMKTSNADPELACLSLDVRI